MIYEDGAKWTEAKQKKALLFAIVIYLFALKRR